MKRKNRSVDGKWRAVLLVAAVWALPVFAQSTDEVLVTRKTVPVATIKDKATINFFVEQYFITEGKIDSMEVIDVNGDDSFNEKDVLEVYPSKQVYSLSESDTALAIMRNWKRSNFITVIGSKTKRGEFVTKTNYLAARNMFGGLVRLLERNYVGKKLKLQFDFDGTDDGVATLYVWGFHDREELLKPPSAGDQFAHDLVFYTRTDTVYVEKPVYDVIYIEQTVTDTVYVKRGGP
jgi:hypothetical protein